MNVSQSSRTSAVTDDGFSCTHSLAPNRSNEAGTDTMLPQACEQNLEQLGGETRIAPELARDQENRRLVEAWRSGDESAKDRLIQVNLGLIQRIANQKARKYRRNDGDFFALAWETMVIALDALYRTRHSTTRHTMS